MRILRITSLFLFLLAFASKAYSSFKIDKNLLNENISQNLEYIEDKEHRLDLDRIISDKGLKWVKVDDNYVNFGYTRYFWSRCSAGHDFFV